MVAAGLTQAQAVAMSVIVFAGSAQLAVLPLFIVEAPIAVMLATTLVVNLRYVIYSAVLAPHFQHLSRPWRALLSYITVDGVFALFAGRFPPGCRIVFPIAGLHALRRRQISMNCVNCCENSI